MVSSPLPRTPQKVLIFIAGLTLLRLLWHTLTPVGMLGDESYYWLWGQHWDWGYFSKPPLIGWLYGGLDFLPLPKVWLFKSAAALFTAGSLYCFYHTLLVVTQRSEIAWWGLLGMAMSPANVLFASMLTIDAPLMFFWTGGMYFTAQLIFRAEKPRIQDYLGLGAFLGLGHLTKQMMLLQVIIILLCALCLRRALLRDLRLWAALLLPFLALLPALLWNAQNNWITFEHTAHHFEASSPTWQKSFQRLGDLWGALFGLFSPLLFLQLFPAIASAARRPSHRARFFFFLFGGLGLIVMTFLVFRQRVNPNWPAVYLIGGLAMILLWAFESPNRLRWYKRGVGLAAIMSLLLMGLFPLLEPLSGPLAKLGIKPQRRGWQGYPELVEKTAGLATQFQVDQILFVGHRFAASQFAFYGPFPKRVHLWNGSEKVRNQFDFFPAPQRGKPLLIVVEQKKPEHDVALPTALIPLLGSVSVVADYPFHPAREFPRYTIYLASKVIGWKDSPSEE